MLYCLYCIFQCSTITFKALNLSCSLVFFMFFILQNYSGATSKLLNKMDSLYLLGDSDYGSSQSCCSSDDCKILTEIRSQNLFFLVKACCSFKENLLCKITIPHIIKAHRNNTKGKLMKQAKDLMSRRGVQTIRDDSII